MKEAKASLKNSHKHWVVENKKIPSWKTLGLAAWMSSTQCMLLFHLNFKGQCHKIFDYWFFSWISFPQAPEYTIVHLWEVELTYRYIFAFKFTLRSQQPDIVPLFATGVIGSGGKLPPVSTLAKLVAKFAPGVVETGGAPWLANISANFRKNVKWS